MSYDLGLSPDSELFNDFELIARPSTDFVNAAGASNVSGAGRVQPLIHRGGIRANVLPAGTIPTRAPIRRAPHEP